MFIIVNILWTEAVRQTVQILQRNTAPRLSERRRFVVSLNDNIAVIICSNHRCGRSRRLFQIKFFSKWHEALIVVKAMSAKSVFQNYGFVVFLEVYVGSVAVQA